MFTSTSTRTSQLARLAVFCALLALALALLSACGASTTSTGGTSTSNAPQHPVFATDALGNPITIPARAPQRIVSETAADSEILAALGVDARVVAVDFYTDTPADLAAKPKITDGQSFNLNVEAIIGYHPDLVLGYNIFFKSDEEKLLAAGVPVVDLPNVATIQNSLDELTLVGQLTHEDATAQRVVADLQKRISAVKTKVAGTASPTVYMESGTYNGQFSTFGKGSYGDELIRTAVGTNIFAGDADSGGYPNVSAEAIVKANPQVIVTTEGGPDGSPSTVAARPGWSAIAAVQSGHVYALDMNDFGRPDAPRIVNALEALAKALHPNLFT
ncbi:MAG TPA: ABC transporter substrate-binding protein [Ktedonobacterales bacterium]|nr:ABC transporter substrate-binding protein [Ktedonobacterales bacterium]